MVFKRREKAPFWTRVRELLAPRKGWSRGFRYIGKRVQRLPDTPHRIALGFACGALASFTPFFTLHAFVAAFFAWAVRANIIAGIFGTIVGNPISFGFIAYVCMLMGNFILGRTGGEGDLDRLSFTYVWENPIEFFDLIFLPYLIGGVIPGALAAAAAYFVLKPLIGRFQKRRKNVLAARARDLVAARGLRKAAREAAPRDARRRREGDDPPAGGGDAASERPAQDGSTPEPLQAGEAPSRRPPLGPERSLSSPLRRRRPGTAT